MTDSPKKDFDTAHILRFLSRVLTSSSIWTVLGGAASILSAIIALYAVTKAVSSLELQSKQYNEESFQRRQGAIALALTTLKDAIDQKEEIGQSNALIYLAKTGHSFSNLVLMDSSINIFSKEINSGSVLLFNMDSAVLCGTKVVNFDDSALFSLRRSDLTNSLLRGYFGSINADGADLSYSQLNNAIADNASFVGAKMSKVIFTGGRYKFADFQGADLSGALTRRGIDQNLNFSPDGNFSPYGTEYAFIARSWEAIVDKKFSPAEALDKLGLKYIDRTSNHLVDFTGAHFYHADLRGADLSNSNITQAQLNEACEDEVTKLPDITMELNKCVIGDHESQIINSIRLGRPKLGYPFCTTERMIQE